MSDKVKIAGLGYIAVLVGGYMVFVYKMAKMAK